MSSQHELLLQQEKLQDSQEQMESSIHSNLDQLTQEKALIASGQQQVAQLIEGITKRMGENRETRAWSIPRLPRAEVLQRLQTAVGRRRGLTSHPTTCLVWGEVPSYMEE